MKGSKESSSLPPDKLLKACLLSALYGVRNERQFCERLDYDLLFRFFLDMRLEEERFDAPTFARNKESLLKADGARLFFEAVVGRARQEALMSPEHFMLDGRLLEEWTRLQPRVPPNLLDPELCLDLHPLMHRLRREDPVHWSPQLGGWVLTRFDDISAMLRDTRVTDASTTARIDRLPEAERQQLTPLRSSIALWMGHTRREDHLRFQQFLKKYFSHRTVEALRPKTQALLDRLIDSILQREEFEFVHELAHPISAGVIAEMLGTPTEELQQLQRWSRELNLLFRARDLQDLLQVQQTILEMEAYLKDFLPARRHDRREDLISVFLDGLADGSIHSEEEIIANCILLLFAAEDTMASMISNGMRVLLQHPDQLERLRHEPELLPTAIEEMMRFDGPSTMINRLAVESFELGGKQIEAGHMIYLVLHAGNRDPDVFPDPDRFDVGRKLMKHLAFGYGPSYCLGAALARMEAHVFFDTVLRRMPDLRLGVDESPWMPLPPLWRRMKSLRVST